MSRAGVDVWEKLCFEARQLATEMNVPGRSDGVRVDDSEVPLSTVIFVTNGFVASTPVSARLLVTLRDAPGTVGLSVMPTFTIGREASDVASNMFHMAVSENGQYVLMMGGEAVQGSNFARHFLALSEDLLRRRFPGVSLVTL